MHKINQPTNPKIHLLLPSRTLPPLKPLQPTQKQPRGKENHSEIKHAISQENPKIRPFPRKKHIETFSIFIAVGELAELAQTIDAILDVPAVLGNKIGCVALARLAGWRGKSGEFAGPADQGAAVNGDAE